MTNGTAIHRTLDALGWLVFIKARRQHRALVALSLVVVLIALRVYFGASLEKLAWAAPVIAFVYKTPTWKDWADVWKEKEDRHENRRKTSLDLHLQFLRVLERKPTDQTMRSYGIRSIAEQQLIVKSIKLLDSVMRERLGLYDDVDLHTTMRITDEDGQYRYFYETEQEKFRGDSTVENDHSKLLDYPQIECLNIEKDRYKCTFWANIDAARHKSLALSQDYLSDKFKSVLAVTLKTELTSGFKLQFLFESKRRFEFGSSRRNLEMLREISPFFLIAKMAVQYKESREAVT